MDALRRSIAPLGLLAAFAVTLGAGAANALQKESAPAAPPQAAPPQVAQSRPGTPALTLASKLAGLPILDSAGGAQAKVMDTLVEPAGTIVLLVERNGGGIVAIPLDVLRLRFSDDAVQQADEQAPPDPARSPRDPDELTAPRRLVGLTLAADADRLAAAPQVAGNALDAIDPAWVAKVRAHWRDPVQPKQPAGPTPADGRLHPEGRPYSDSLPGVAERQGAQKPPATEAAPVASTVIRATALDGKDVQSPTGEGVGEVEDLVVNLPEARLAYVVIDTGGIFGAGSVHHGVPLEALSFGGHDGGLVLQVPDWKALDSRAGIDLDHLPVQPTITGGATQAAPPQATQPAPTPAEPRQPSDEPGAAPSNPPR